MNKDNRFIRLNFVFVAALAPVEPSGASVWAPLPGGLFDVFVHTELVYPS